MGNCQEIIQRQRDFFKTGATREPAWRQANLTRLKNAVRRHEAEINAALKADLNKSEHEAYATEIGFILAEISHAVKHLAAWAKPRPVKTPVTHFGAASLIYPEPYGVALIISPWNYPFNLALSPLIGAMAAGNCAIIKPSELSPHTSRIIAQLIGDNFPPDYLYVAEGGVDTSTALLAEKFDYIFFTGSGPVGRVVMAAAARYLTPLTLELGGKSPCIIHADANLPLAAKRTVWGKFTNAGQTCIAPDYLLVHQSVKPRFLQYLADSIRELYGEDARTNEDYPRIINERHFHRLTAYLESGEITLGGRTDKSRLLIEPTILDKVHWDDPVMQEEIFGPILPVLEYQEIDEVIELVTGRPRPLALYLFTESRPVEEQILKSIPFGGGCVNDTVMHIANPYLPFGGVGESGQGGYHGQASFEIFSHHKSVLKQTTRFDIPVRYPNTKNALALIKRFFR